MTMRTALLSLTGRKCPCGALIEHSDKRCRKCRARARWRRRKSIHDGL
jgi:hypothetical protein